MDKTYAETQGLAPFDWNLFLANPPELQSIEHSAAIKRAEMWTTCACGNQCAVIPRESSDIPARNGAPDDARLRGLGYDFYSRIHAGDWESAKAKLAAIEARSAVLIQEELAKLNP